ncbi:MAG: polysaccharide deacetylase family protein [Ardenticatenaceae bacterium]
MKHQNLKLETTNRAAVTTGVAWPDQKKSCLFIAFDFDAETAWFDEHAADSKQLVRMSHGGYGARVGVPKVLELLHRLELSATFFVPGWVAETYTQMCERILKAGHEIGHHGYYHLKPSIGAGGLEQIDSLEQSYAEIDRGFEALERCLGVKPIGYRAPCGENYDLILQYLSEKGIKYSSSWRDDIMPYRHILDSGKTGPLELPANSAFDDWNHGVVKGSSRNMLSREQVLSIWNDELNQTHAWGGLTTTIFHPQVSGRPSRFMILEQFLTYAQTLDDLWITKGEVILNHIDKNGLMTD